MRKSAKLQTKLLTCGILLTILPLAVVSLVVLLQNAKMVKVAQDESAKSANSDLDHVAKSVYEMCRIQQESLQQSVDQALSAARRALQQAGAVHFAPETVAWDAVDQFTNVATKVDLPKMMVGDAWLDKVTDVNRKALVVDTVRESIGGTCTIFQRMNEAGDMLRVCTNVTKKDGTRAIGTYIPRNNADGKPNPVVATVLRGEAYHGRAVVVGSWYTAAYEPIRDASNKVVGMLYVGVPEDNAKALRATIMDIKLGQTGYVYVMDSKGNYIVSAGGKRDGECIWDAKDADGTLFIQEISRKALALKPGDFAEQRYRWKNEGDAVAREKIVRIMYYEPWDWVIGAGSYTDEIYQAQYLIGAIGKKSNVVLGGVLLAAFLVAATTWFFIARGLAGKIHHIVARLSEGAEQVSSASGQVSAASQSLAEGATEQAAGLEETSSSLEEMSSMTKQNADNAQQANTLAAEAKKAATTGAESMGRMNAAIHEIQKSSDETAKIIKVIDEIAFQTNLLALNAAVEAARAGEAGKGFAVVAEEVRNLAMRSAEAAKNTASMIEESVKNSKNGVDIATEVSKVLAEIVQSVGKTTDLVSEIAAASQEQAQGIDQVNTAVSQMDKVTQQNAANAEESASASEELSAQAESMKEVVGELVALVGGAHAQTAHSGGPKGDRHEMHPDVEHKLHSIQKSKSHGFGKSDELLHKIAGRPDRLRRAPSGSADKTIPLNGGASDLSEFNT